MDANPAPAADDYVAAISEITTATSDLRQWGLRLSAVGLTTAGDRILELVLIVEQQAAVLERLGTTGRSRRRPPSTTD